MKKTCILAVCLALSSFCFGMGFSKEQCWWPIRYLITLDQIRHSVWQKMTQCCSNSRKGDTDKPPRSEDYIYEQIFEDE